MAKSRVQIQGKEFDIVSSNERLTKSLPSSVVINSSQTIFTAAVLQNYTPLTYTFQLPKNAYLRNVYCSAYLLPLAGGFQHAPDYLSFTMSAVGANPFYRPNISAGVNTPSLDLSKGGSQGEIDKDFKERDLYFLTSNTYSVLVAVGVAAVVGDQIGANILLTFDLL
jgi:hypothetical protein